MGASKYIPSGRVGVVAIPAGLALGGVVALACAYPFTYMVMEGNKLPGLGGGAALSAPLTVAYGFVIGWATKFGLMRGLCRNIVVAAAVGVVCAAAGVFWSLHLAHAWGRAEIAEQAQLELRGASPSINPDAADLGLSAYHDQQKAGRARVAALRRMTLSEFMDHDSGVSRFRLLIGLIVVCGLSAVVAMRAGDTRTCERCRVKMGSETIGYQRGVSRRALRQAQHGGTICDFLAVEEGGGDAVFTWKLERCPRCTRTVYVSANAHWERLRQYTPTPGLPSEGGFMFSRMTPAKPMKTVVRKEEVILSSVAPSDADLAALQERFPPKRRGKRAKPRP